MLKEKPAVISYCGQEIQIKCPRNEEFFIVDQLDILSLVCFYRLTYNNVRFFKWAHAIGTLPYVVYLITLQHLYIQGEQSKHDVLDSVRIIKSSKLSTPFTVLNQLELNCSSN